MDLKSKIDYIKEFADNDFYSSFGDYCLEKTHGFEDSNYFRAVVFLTYNVFYQASRVSESNYVDENHQIDKLLDWDENSKLLLAININQSKIAHLNHDEIKSMKSMRLRNVLELIIRNKN